MVELVSTIEQVVENVETLFLYGEMPNGPERDFHDKRIKNGKLFAVVQAETGYKFAPSKFAGYISNNLSHADALKERDGRLTNNELKRLVGDPLESGDKAYAEIDRAFLEYCGVKKIEPSKHHRQRRYWVLVTGY